MLPCASITNYAHKRFGNNLVAFHWNTQDEVHKIFIRRKVLIRLKIQNKPIREVEEILELATPTICKILEKS